MSILSALRKANTRSWLPSSLEGCFILGGEIVSLWNIAFCCCPFCIFPCCLLCGEILKKCKLTYKFKDFYVNT